MKSALALSAIAAIFLIGTVVGAMGKHVYEAHHGHGEHASHGTGHDRLNDLLDLTDEQRVEVERIMFDAHREARALHDRLLPEVHAHIDRVHERISEVLNPEQQAVFAELLERQSRQMQRMLLAGPSLDEHGENVHDPEHGSGRNDGDDP